MFCENCGKEIKDENKFCPYCGAACPTAELEEKAADVIEQADEELKEAAEAEVTEVSETAEEPDEVDSILAQSVKTTEEGSDPKTWYITCFSEDGIWCKKFTEGQEGEDLWRMEFTDPSQYQKVLNYLQSFAEGEEVPHAEEEDFWRRFLEEDAR